MLSYSAFILNSTHSVTLKRHADVLTAPLKTLSERTLASFQFNSDAEMKAKRGTSKREINRPVKRDKGRFSASTGSSGTARGYDRAADASFCQHTEQKDRSKSACRKAGRRDTYGMTD